jgi:hypothetical protein
MSFIAKTISIGRYALVTHEGKFTREEFEEARSIAKIILDEHRWDKLLVDLRGIVSRMPTADKLFAMESNVRVLPEVKIGLVFPLKLKEEGRFAETVSANRGVNLKSFVDYEQAVAWLTNELTSSDSRRLRSNRASLPRQGSALWGS